MDFSSFFLLTSIILPFVLIKQAPPNLWFFSELISCISCCLFVIFSIKTQNLITNNLITIYLIAILFYLIFDIVIHPPIYLSQTFLFIGSLLIAILLSNTLENLKAEGEIYSKIPNIVCKALMIGSLLQDFIILCQLLNLDFSWTLVSDGNIGQRNLLAHYLTWGILATAYLTFKKSLKLDYGILLTIFQAFCLGTTSSRTLIFYCLTMIIVIFLLKIRKNYLSSELARYLFATIGLVIMFQIITLPLLSLFDFTENSLTSVSRLSESSGITSRINEWHKALIIFSNNPWFGAGWDSYGYEGFKISYSPAFVDTTYEGRLFTHTHNIVFNLLAETGIIGTFIISGGLLIIFIKSFKRKWTDESLVFFCMLIVTAIHSLLEFPLWNTHFFLVAIIILTTFFISTISNTYHPYFTSKQNNIFRTFIILLSVIIIGICLHLYYSYNQLNNLRFTEEKTQSERVVTAKKMLEIGTNQPLIQAYAEISAINYLAGIPPKFIPRDFAGQLYRYSHYFPSPGVASFYLSQRCNKNFSFSSEDWLYYQQITNYYKDSIQGISVILSMKPQCLNSFRTIYQECKKNNIKNNKKAPCSVTETFMADKYDKIK